jgi:2-polyprenyl-3-methyl-5-hydroxy-6-metoxy-1,4-benzoquinol methylase
MTWSYYADPRPDVQRLLQPRGRTILDVGCGEGALGAALRAAGAAEVVGVELDAQAAEVARSRLDVVVGGDAGSAPVPREAGHFDYLIFADTLEHMADPEAVVDRFLPLLAPNGRVVISVPNMRFLPVLLRLLFDRWSYRDSGIRDRTHLRIFTRGSLASMLLAKGLEIERLERNYRLFEDQSSIGRWGALVTRIVQSTIAPLLFKNLLAFQYIAVARRRAPQRLIED